MVPSQFQKNIFSAVVDGTGDLQVQAVAGSGKTTTIINAVARLPVADQKATMLTAFNKHIETALRQKQVEGKIPAGVSIQTIHGIGNGVLRRAFNPTTGPAWVDGKKYKTLSYLAWDVSKISPLLRTNQKAVRTAIDATETLVRYAQLTLTPPGDSTAMLTMAAHFGIELPPEAYIEATLKAVGQAIKWGMEGLPIPDRNGLTYHPSQRISFDDMVFLPVAMDLEVPKFKFCFVDEVQDFNRAQQELLLMIKGQGRAIWVGDKYQAIYGFTGASADSFDWIARETGATQLPLSICYRCSKAVVNLAQKFVPEVQASDTAADGSVITVTETTLLDTAKAHWLEECKGKAGEPFLILCRTNAPLIENAFRLIRQGVPATVKGKDIGTQLAKAMDEVEKLPVYTTQGFSAGVEAWKTIKLAPLMAKDNAENLIASIIDRADSLEAVYEAVSMEQEEEVTAADVRGRIFQLFADDVSAITFSSIHKAKGLEAENVGLLRPDLLPHPMAKQSWQKEQEKNLAYVAITRAMKNLYLAGEIKFLES